MNWLAVALGGALGSLLRYAVAGVWLSPASLDFPWGTLANSRMALRDLALPAETLAGIEHGNAEALLGR